MKIKRKILKISAFLQTGIAKTLIMVGILLCLLPIVFFDIDDADLVKGLFAIAGVLFILHLAFPENKHEINLNKLKDMLHKKAKNDPSCKNLEEEFKKVEI